MPSRTLNGSNSTTSNTTSTQGDKANEGSVSQLPSRTLNGSNSNTTATTIDSGGQLSITDTLNTHAANNPGTSVRDNVRPTGTGPDFNLLNATVILYSL